VSRDLRCPFCLWPLKADESQRECGDCQARYHEECWQENGGCAIFGCPTWAAGQGVVQPAPVVAPVPAVHPAPGAPAVATATLPAQAAAPATSFCDQCGGRVSPGDRFCGSCGNTLV